MESVLLDVAGHRRSPATMPGYHRGRPLRNKGEQYPADPADGGGDRHSRRHSSRLHAQNRVSNKATYK